MIRNRLFAPSCSGGGIVEVLIMSLMVDVICTAMAELAARPETPIITAVFSPGLLYRVAVRTGVDT